MSVHPILGYCSHSYGTATTRIGKTSRIRWGPADSGAEGPVERGDRSQFPPNRQARTRGLPHPGNERGIVSRLRRCGCVGAAVCASEKQGTNLCACGAHPPRQRHHPSCWAEETSPDVRFLPGSAGRRKSLKAVPPEGLHEGRG